MLKRTLVAGVTVAALAVGGVVAAEAANAGPSNSVAPRTAARSTNAVVPAGTVSTVSPYVTYPGSVKTLTGLRVVPIPVRSGGRVWLFVRIIPPTRYYPLPTGSILVRLGSWSARVTLVRAQAKILILPRLYLHRGQRIRFFPITGQYIPARNSIYKPSWAKVYAIVVR